MIETGSACRPSLVLLHPVWRHLCLTMLKLAGAQNNVAYDEMPLLVRSINPFQPSVCGVFFPLSLPFPRAFSLPVSASGVWLQPPLTLSGFSGLIGCKLASCYESWRGRRSESQWLLLQLNCSWGKKPLLGLRARRPVMAKRGKSWSPLLQKSIRSSSRRRNSVFSPGEDKVSGLSLCPLFPLVTIFCFLSCVFPLLEGFRNYLKDQKYEYLGHCVWGEWSALTSSKAKTLLSSLESSFRCSFETSSTLQRDILVSVFGEWCYWKWNLAKTGLSEEEDRLF